MTLTQLFVTSFMVSLSGSITPGPLVAVTIRYALRRGPMAGVVMSVSHGLTEFVVLLLLVSFLGRIDITPTAVTVLSFLGAGFMTYLGLTTFKEGWTSGKNDPEWSVDGKDGNLSSTDGTADRSAAAASWRPLFLAGIVTTVTNPVWVVWWGTLGVNYIIWSMDYGYLGLGLFFSGHLAANAAFFILFAVLAAGSKKYFGGQVYRVMMMGLGVFLLGFAVYFFRLAFGSVLG
ncbi:MAG: LysE family transporter [Firmicutes bacterium]|nr:LysE family transporter [Bacillota bacterium]